MRLIHRVTPSPPPSTLYTIELTAQEMSAIFAALSDTSSARTQQFIVDNWSDTMPVPEDEAWTLYKEFKRLLTGRN